MAGTGGTWRCSLSHTLFHTLTLFLSLTHTHTNSLSLSHTHTHTVDGADDDGAVLVADADLLPIRAPERDNRLRALSPEKEKNMLTTGCEPSEQHVCRL